MFFPTLPTKSSIQNFLNPKTIKEKISSKKTSIKNAARQQVLDLVFKTSDMTDTFLELRKLTHDAAIDIMPIVKAEIVNRVFPKVARLTPGDLVYYRPIETSVATTPPSQRATLNPKVFKTFVYTFDGVYVPSTKKNSSTVGIEELPTIMYTQSRDIPPEAVVMFIGYGHAESSMLSVSTPITKAMDFLHSKATILYDEKVYVVGFPKLPWSKFFIPDDILEKIDNQHHHDNQEYTSSADDYDDQDPEKTGGSSFHATLF